MNRKLTRTVLASAAISVGSASLAHASGNLIQNGSFETGDFSSWTLTGDTTFTGVCDVSTCPGNFAPEDGNFAAYFGPKGDTATLSQEIPTTAGDYYKIHFFLADPVGGDPIYFEADWGVTVMKVLDKTSPLLWTEFSFIEMATGPETDLSFTFQNDPGYFFLDNVQVSQSAPTSEPESVALFGTGLVGILAMLRRKLRG